MFFKEGDIVRYDTDGSTALMQITHISRKHGGNADRYYGTQCMGGSIGAYSYDVTRPTAKDLETWEETKSWRKK